MGKHKNALFFYAHINNIHNNKQYTAVSNHTLYLWRKPEKNKQNKVNAADECKEKGGGFNQTGRSQAYDKILIIKFTLVYLNIFFHERYWSNKSFFHSLEKSFQSFISILCYRQYILNVK